VLYSSSVLEKLKLHNNLSMSHTGIYDDRNPDYMTNSLSLMSNCIIRFDEKKLKCTNCLIEWQSASLEVLYWSIP
jgi:hypothetical protein